MSKEILKEKFKNCVPIFGAWTVISHTAVSEIFAKVLKPDFVAIDIEHSPISAEDARHLFTVIQAQGCVVLPRIASHDKADIQKLLDAGADGIIVPSVNNETELSLIIDALKYPPLGKRGYGVYRAHDYGANFENYVASWNSSSILILIIETLEGVTNADALINNPHVDAVLIGQYDLSGAYQVPGQLNHPKVQEACKKIRECCKTSKKSCITLISDVTQDSLQQALESNNCIILDTDVSILWHWCHKTRGIIDSYKSQLN